MHHLVCHEQADSRRSELGHGRQLGWGWGVLCLAQDKLGQWFFKLLGRALKFPRVCLRSPCGRKYVCQERALSWLGYSLSNRTASLVAVLHIGVQGKLLFALRVLLLIKVRKPLTRPSAPNWSLHSPDLGRWWRGVTLYLALCCRTSIPVSAPGGLQQMGMGDCDQVTKMPSSEACVTPAGRRGYFLEGEGLNLDSQKQSLHGTTVDSLGLFCPS